MKKSLNEIYGYIALAVGLIIIVDSLFHPIGNIAAVVVLLVACYRIGQLAK